MNLILILFLFWNNKLAKKIDLHISYNCILLLKILDT